MPVVIQWSRISSVRSMVTALTCTPSTSTCGIDRSATSSNRTGHLPLAQRFRDLRLDPGIRLRNSRLERHLRLPPQHLPEPVVVGVAAAHALRAVDVALGDRDAGGPGNHVSEVVDADQTVLAEIEWFAMRRVHQPLQPLHAVVDVAE